MSSRNAPLATLPPDERGSSATCTNRSGNCSFPTPLACRNAMISGRVTGTFPPVVTYTQTRSPKTSSGMETAATRSTAGCSAISASRAGALMFLPPRMMMSEARPMTRR